MAGRAGRAAGGATPTPCQPLRHPPSTYLGRLQRGVVRGARRAGGERGPVCGRLRGRRRAGGGQQEREPHRWVVGGWGPARAPQSDQRRAPRPPTTPAPGGAGCRVRRAVHATTTMGDALREPPRAAPPAAPIARTCTCGHRAATALGLRRHQRACPARAGENAPPRPLRERVLNQLSSFPASHAVAGDEAGCEPGLGGVATALFRRAAAAGGAPPSPFSADDLEALLAWERPGPSLKVLAGTLYALLCAHAASHAPAGAPAGAALAAAGAVLAWHTVAPTLLAALSAACFVGRSWGLLPPPRRAAAVSAPAPPTTDAAVAAAVEGAIRRAAAAVAPVAGAVAAVTYRRLGPRAAAAQRAWTAAALALLAAAARASAASTATLAAVTVLCSFAAAPAATALAGGADAVALEALAAARAVVAADARSAAGAAVAAVAVWACLEGGSVLLRAGAGVAAAGAVLAWRLGAGEVA